MATKGAQRHNLRDIDAQLRTALCSVCGPTQLMSDGLRNGERVWKCRVVWQRNNQLEHRKHVQDVCGMCGFQGELCQMDINHIDGDFTNNESSNLETLCANCHRLVTYRRRHSRFRVARGLPAHPDRPR